MSGLSDRVSVAKGEDIVSDGSSDVSLTVILQGVACAYKILPVGQRQILAFLLPGDWAGVSSLGLGFSDHGVSASTDCVVARLPRDHMQRMRDCFPNFAQAMWRYCLVQSSMYRSWLANTRRRSAAERLAHLFCEQFARLQAVGLAEPGKPVSLHIVQTDLADATGMSVVHLNRTLQFLRRRRVIGRNPNTLEILDWDTLQELAGFDPAYLHLRDVDNHGYSRGSSDCTLPGEQELQLSSVSNV